MPTVPVFEVVWVAVLQPHLLLQAVTATFLSGLRYTRLYLLVMGVSVLIRPTGAIMWPPIVLAQYVIDRHRIVGVLKDTVGMG